MITEILSLYICFNIALNYYTIWFGLHIIFVSKISKKNNVIHFHEQSEYFNLFSNDRLFDLPLFASHF